MSHEVVRRRCRWRQKNCVIKDAGGETLKLK